jgi:hypothetical protein
MPRINPFIAGSIVTGTDFINRERELSAVFQRLRSRQSTAISGTPRIGKTSLLFRLQDSKIQAKYVAPAISKKWISCYMSAQTFEASFTSQKFWNEVLETVKARPGTKGISRLIREAEISHYDGRSLRRLFEAIRARDGLLILLLDEFECLLSHDGFQDPGFYGVLRDLSNNGKGLTLVVSSRLSLYDLLKLVPVLPNPGSKLLDFNVTVQPFSDDAIEKLLGRPPSRFSAEQRLFIRRIAGRNPFFLQAMGGALAETRLSGKDAIEEAANIYHESVRAPFNDVWDCLSDKERTVAVLLAVMTLNGRVLGNSFNYGEIERSDVFEPELDKLAQRGIAEIVDSSSRGWIVDSKNILIWRGERWALGCEAFAWWIRDVIIAQTRSIPSYDEWLHDKRYLGLITQKQWDLIKGAIVKMPPWAVRSVAGLAGALWEEVRRAAK